MSKDRDVDAVSNGNLAIPEESPEAVSVCPWGRGDVVALLVWTVAVALFFWDAVSLRRALFYFDITEINYPYRAFFAEELKAGRFSRWCPNLFCGLPLFSESQAGYLHPLKYLFYPWLPTWQAFNLDTVFSVWLIGLGTYGWLRRHVGPPGALTGAAVFGCSGYVWGHLIHTSMINALASVPFVVWGLESAWTTGRWRGLVLGSLALAFQVFAGHLQDSLLTIGLIGLYGLSRAATERSLGQRVRALGMSLVLVALGVLLSGIQWVPSKELLDRSPRAGGLKWEDLTYGSWSLELLPTLVVREAYGTRARDTDWMDGYYPYHEMNAYMGLIALALAAVGAQGPGARDRWTSFWVILVGIGFVLMLGKFTFLFDIAHRLPVLGSSREPVRFHVWVSLGVAALAATGVDRLGRPGAVSLKAGLWLAGCLVAVSTAIVIGIYFPVWAQPKRFTLSYHLDRYRWLGRELLMASARTVFLVGLGWWVARAATRAVNPTRRGRLAAILPFLVLADLLSAHWVDVPTIDPAYWTKPPETARRLQADPATIRIFGVPERGAGDPGYASEPVDFMGVRDLLEWSLPSVWHLRASRGITPMISQRLVDFGDQKIDRVRLDLESTTHVLTGRLTRPGYTDMPSVRVGTAYVHRNENALPRVRLVGKPVYAADQYGAAALFPKLGASLRDRIVVEDPDRPLAADTLVSGTAQIVDEIPERVVVETKAAMPAYLVFGDTFDPGWSASVDGLPAPIRPAYIAFRAVFVPAGNHTVIFSYRPAGFALGAMLSGCGILLALVIWFRSPRSPALAAEHAALDWPKRWQTWWFLMLGAIVLVSAVDFRPSGRPGLQSRWRTGFHQHTWGAGTRPLKANRM